MRNNKLLLVGIVCLSFNSFQAQESVHGSGGNATGSGGSVSYSLGQVLYTTASGTTGSTAAGVQQPFEIQTVLGNENFNISLEMVVYPNPTTNLLMLEVKNYGLENLEYQLFDLNGRLIVDEKINTETTTISMEQYPSAVYLLKVIDNNKEIKTFKILKNNS